jgi:NAD(P)-dependent dehydrogenase (short-subunit alcohol dehydrogenase family)
LSVSRYWKQVAEPVSIATREMSRTMAKLLENKVVFVSGAAAGIGRATAMLAAAEGALVIVADVDEGAANDCATAIGPAAIPKAIDVSDSNAFSDCIASIIAEYGRLDGAVNNAGIPGANAFIADYPDATFSRVVEVNLKGVWNALQAQIPAMLAKGSGSIVNIASIGGLVGKDGQSAYIASKHGVIGLTKTAALEYGKQGLRINAVCPGIIQTAMIDTIIAGDAGSSDFWNNLQPIGRMGQASEVAEAIVWLLSDRASLVHGHALVADGAYTSG